MKIIYATLALLMLPFWVQAQYQISGSVQDQSHEALSYANTLLYTSDTSTFIKGAIVDIEGNFVLEAVSNGNYLLEISMVGYQSYFQAIEIKDASKNIGTIQLASDQAILETVTVTAKKPLFERQVDRMVVNVKEAITATGGNALEVLEKSPGVMVDRVNNSIALMGKDIVVAINGKRVRLEGDALVQMLNSISNESIQKIELIDNPPASYDAQGAGGVINIILAKSENEGFNGNFSLFGGYGERPKGGGSFNINIRKGRWNIFADVSTNNNWTQQDNFLNQLLPHEGQWIFAEQHGQRPAFIGNHSGRVGADISLTDKISFSTYGKASKRIWGLDGLTTTKYDQALNGANFELLNSDESNQTDHWMVSNNLSIQINEKQRLSFDYDYLYYEIDNPTTYDLNRMTTAGDTVEQRRFSSSKLTPFDFHVAKADYEIQVSPKFQFQAGVKATIADVQNITQLLYEIPEAGVDPFFTDDITLDEKIFAAYTSGTFNFTDKTSLIAGVRFERLDFDLFSQKDGPLIDRIRNRFFPNITVSHSFTDTRKLSLSFNQRINRPGFQVLAPAFYFLDVNSVLAGNINALPTLSSTVGFKPEPGDV